MDPSKLPATLVPLTARECVVESALVEGVEARGGMAEKTQVLGRRGFFDRLVTLPGGHVHFVELKRPKRGRVSLHQEIRAAAYRGRGCSVWIINGQRDLDAFFKVADEQIAASRKIFAL